MQMICKITVLLFPWWFRCAPILQIWAFSSPLPPSSHSLSVSPLSTDLSPSREYHPVKLLPPNNIYGASTRLNSEARDRDCKSIGDHKEAGDLPLLFVEPDLPIQSTIDISHAKVPPSLIYSIKRVRNRYLSNLPPNVNDDSGATSNEDLLKKIVQAGIHFQQKQTHQTSATNDPYSTEQILSFPTRERVPGCIASAHLKTTMIPILDCPSADDPSKYFVFIEGTADAMLSGGLLAILSHTFTGGTTEKVGSNAQEKIVTAADILNLDPETLTTSLGLQSVLSRGRNDGVASMVRVVQRQIKSLMGEKYSSSNNSDEKSGAVNEKMNQLLKSTYSNISQKNSTRKPTVAVLLSGGVDSSVALHLLLRQNLNVTAFYLRIWLEDELAHLGECPWEEDLRVCQLVTEHAGNVPLETVSLGKEYRNLVVQYTIEEAQRGRTPNPDIMCNSRVKFGCFLEYIERSEMKFDYVASGHYARLEDEVPTNTMQHPRKRLFRAPDPIKDQSYFLCALTQKQLSKVIFPIGNYMKSEVRELAAHFQLPNRDRPDSQGLCFLGKIRFDDFLASYLGNKPGDIVDASDGEVIGRHNGLWYHTVGQRKGIGKVLNPTETAKGPWYVVAKDPKRDIVYVSNRYEEEDFARARSEFEAEDVRWISGEPPVESLSADGSEKRWKEVRMDMKIRHGPRIVQGTLLLKGDGSTGNISLEKKNGLAPGQYVVFYRFGTDECLGAGVISERHWAKFLAALA